MDTRARDLKEQGDKLFTNRQSLLSLWQTTADNFYPERADFTRTFTLGEEFAAHLMTGAPVMARRDLANQFHAMLRPRQKPWFRARTMNDRLNKDPGALKWLDWASERMRQVMYDPGAAFVRATSQGDHDFAAFGQTVLQLTPNRTNDGLLYRNWHLRDVVWCESSDLVIDTIHRDWKIEARELVRLFPKTVDQKVRECLNKEPYKLIKCRHIVVPADNYDLRDKKPRNGGKFPYVSLYIDCDNETVLEEVPASSTGYIIPRWQTVSGSQYAYSPATVVGLPDARLLQQITLTLLESGQKAVDPPMIAVAEAIAGGANLMAGGITWADAEYDERLGEVLRPVYSDSKALNWGVDREERIMKAIMDAFYLNQIQLPEIGKDMTAFETQKRVEEYVRRALPLFEPMETEYNGGLCNETFDLVMRMGGFGPREDIPDALRGQEIKFVFESPLMAATERAKAEAFQQSAGLLQIAAEIGVTGAKHNMDWDKAFRDALSGVGAPSEWLLDAEKVEEAKQAEAMMAQVQEAMAAVSQGAEVAQQVGVAGQEMQMAGMM